MPYSVKIFSADDVSRTDCEMAEQRFRRALENVLGDEGLVLPCYEAYSRLIEKFGQNPRPWPLTPEEQLLIEQWEEAELAATQAAFGVHRYLGDADFEILAAS